MLIIRIALDNVHPSELGENARRALDRLLDGKTYRLVPRLMDAGTSLYMVSP